MFTFASFFCSWASFFFFFSLRLSGYRPRSMAVKKKEGKKRGPCYVSFGYLKKKSWEDYVIYITKKHLFVKKKNSVLTGKLVTRKRRVSVEDEGQFKQSTIKIARLITSELLCVFHVICATKPLCFLLMWQDNFWLRIILFWR